LINERIDIVDFKWVNVGDFAFSSGDVLDTYNSFGEGFIQEVLTRIDSSFGDWKTNRELGSTLSNHEGMSNTEATGRSLEASVQGCLTKDGFLTLSDFTVTSVPVGIHQILLTISFIGILTDKPINSTISLSIIYDLTGKGSYLVK
jgi:hypothetical protein